jgi:hypothetical protein
LSAEAPVPTADPLSRRYDQQDHCCCEDAGHTECPAGGSMHAYRLPTNIDPDEAAVASPGCPVDVIDLDRCIPAATPDSSQHPNQPNHDDGDASASGVDPVSSLVQPTPVQVATEQASHRHNRRPAVVFTASAPGT